MNAPGPAASLVNRAYQLAKHRILHADMLPDSFVDEAGLAAELGSSKTPVRQALNRLAQEGFIRILPQRGTLVNRVTIADIQQVYYLREIVEPAAAELAASRATPAQIEAVRALDHELVHNTEAPLDLDLHNRIHVSLAAMGGLPRLTRMVAELQDSMQWFLAVRAALGGPVVPRHHHTEIIDAIASGDPANAKAITERNIRESRDQIVRVERGLFGDGFYAPDPFDWQQDPILRG